MPSLERHLRGGVALLTDERVGGGVTFAFTERTGGVSAAPYSSLNLGGRCGDDPRAVAENRRRALVALGAEGLLDRLVEPRQVHVSPTSFKTDIPLDELLELYRQFSPDSQ